MKKNKRRTPLPPKEVVQLATQIRSKLTQSGVNLKPDTRIDWVPVHLADIYEVSVAYQFLLDELLEVLPSQKRRAIHLLEQMDQHLCVHLPYHLRHLSKALDDLTKDLKRKKISKAKKRGG